MIKRPPDFVIGNDPENPYLRRWWIIPRNRWFNIYLHEILRSDDDRALHDHPWWNISIILKGGYLEWKPGGYVTEYPLWRGVGRLVFRRAVTAHRLEIDPSVGPCLSLFITGPRIREWGFHCPNGWRRWQDFCAPADKGQIGRGCD